MNNEPAADPSLFSIPEKPRSRTSDVLLEMVEQTKQGKVTLRGLTHRLGDRTFGMLLILLAVFNLVPLVSIFVGLLIFVLGIQMLFGMPEPKLPSFILDRELAGDKVRFALEKFEPKVRKFENYIRPRWHFTEAAIIDRINGLIIAALGLFITLPFPFTNLPPALVLIVMGLGLMERDGLVQLLAATSGISAIVLLWFFIF